MIKSAIYYSIEFFIVLALTMYMAVLLLPYILVFFYTLAAVTFFCFFIKPEKFKSQEGVSPVMMLWRQLSICLNLTAAFAPGRALGIVILDSFGRDPSKISPGHWFDFSVGICGVIGWLVYLISDGHWRLKQARHVRNIATSKAGSAAIGLSEFRGIARQFEDTFFIPHPVGREAILYYQYNELNQGGDHVRKFFVEDETGRVLVDPAGISIHLSFLRTIFENIFFPYPKGSIREIVLSKHRRNRRKIFESEGWLQDGDPVYLLGNVQVNKNASDEAKESERLIITGSKARGYFDEGYFSRRDIDDVFFCSDSYSEKKAERFIMRGFWFNCVLRSVLWISVSSLLILL